MNYELDDFETGLKTLLASWSAIDRVFQSMRAARKAASPFVIFLLQPGRDDVIGNGTGVDALLMSRPSYIVETVTLGPPTNASKTIAGALYTNLAAGHFTISGFQVDSRRMRASSRRTPGANEDEFFVHRGGEYQFWIA